MKAVFILTVLFLRLFPTPAQTVLSGDVEDGFTRVFSDSLLATMDGNWTANMSSHQNAEANRIGHAEMKWLASMRCLAVQFSTIQSGRLFSVTSTIVFDPLKKKYLCIAYDDLSTAFLIGEGEFRRSTNSLVFFGLADGIRCRIEICKVAAKEIRFKFFQIVDSTSTTLTEFLLTKNL
jgi:hypothetical protein